MGTGEAWDYEGEKAPPIRGPSSVYANFPPLTKTIISGPKGQGCRRVSIRINRTRGVPPRGGVYARRAHHRKSFHAHGTAPPRGPIAAIAPRRTRRASNEIAYARIAPRAGSLASPSYPRMVQVLRRPRMGMVDALRH
eukprot:scaffold17572_cov32-Tisochrysis_lutea.AAC.3